MSNAEDLAHQAGERVREVIAEAERHAAEIVQRAEQEAAHIRERAEAEARDKLERARRALSELAGETPDPRPPDPAPQPPTDPVPSPEPVPEPAPPSAADGPASVPATSNGGDDSAARLVAMKMALDGSDREQIAAELDSKFGASDRGALLDDVLARAGR